ncbi:HNH endonuclease signature motif containing protein [Pseudonocardia sp.]|uniref:DUF222 domain-containing protein n=1 Tax=Pseudonocardia sp. TaxID=60912 RepID=UPI00260CC190|nr:HNH endonuclease signature motif containing protein [Pseudonocardia sp.]
MQAVATLPDGLADLPPGPGLAAALDELDLSVVPNDRMPELLGAQYRQLCHEQARMAAVIAEIGRCEGYPGPGTVRRLDAPDRYAPDETRAALRWTRAAADREHELAETVVHGMPALHAAWSAGLVDRPRVLVFDRYLMGLDPAQVSAICRAALPRAATLTTGQLAVLLRRMVLAVDPEAAARWYRKGVRERNVVAVMGPDGTVTISGNGLPADEAEAACLRVQELAAAAKRAGHPGLIGQIRSDLFLGLLDGRFHAMDSARVIATLIAQYRPDRTGPSDVPDDSTETVATDAARPGPVQPGTAGPAAASLGIAPPSAAQPDAAQPSAAQPSESRTEEGGGAGAGGAQCGIEIRVALSTLLGHDEHPGEIPGLGLLPAPDTRARVALQRRAQWRFAVTDPDGRLLTEGVTRHRPAAVGGLAVRRDGPPGGIVELHLPVALLHELVARGPASPTHWAGVVADIAAQHARRLDHLADLDARPGARFPGAALRRHTEIRDRTCSFPGCRHRAHISDIDHTRDHVDGGPTTTANTGPVCAHDHDVKHRGGWRLTQPEPGRFVWRSPLGGEYATRGEFLLPQLPDPHPVDLGPHFDQPTRTLDGPILRPCRPVERPRPPPAKRVLPDDPPF